MGPFRRSVVAVAGVAAATFVLELLVGPLGLDRAHVGLVYLLVVVCSAALGGTAAALVAAFTSFLAWNFFFLPPFYTLVVNDPHDWILLVVFLVIALIVGHMTGRVRAREEEALARSRENAAMYASSVTVGRFSSPQEALPSLLDEIVRATSTRGAEVLCLTAAGPQVVASTSLAREPDDALARFVIEQVKAVGLSPPPDEPLFGDEMWPVSVTHAQVPGGGPATLDVWLPLTYGERALGALRVVPGNDGLSETAQRLLVAFASHVAASLERSRLLDEMRATARTQEEERLKSVLFSSLSHNLKTPLASLSATMSSLLAADVEFDRASLEENLRDMAADLGRLRGHIENLLSLAQLEAGAWKPQLEWVEVSELMSIALRLMPPHDRERVRLDRASSAVLVHVDTVQMGQVLCHLVENAIAYSPSGTAVEVRVVSDDRGLSIQVDDRGPGIDAAEAERVFRKFYRGDAARQSAVRGTGLGLAICKEIVDAHQGTIRVSRAEAGGARLEITLPVEAPPRIDEER